MPIKIKPSTQNFFLNLGMIDLLAESEIEESEKNVLTDEAIENKRIEKRKKYAIIQEKLPKIKIDDLVENYKNNYSIINSDLLRLSNHVKKTLSG